MKALQKVNLQLVNIISSVDCLRESLMEISQYSCIERLDSVRHDLNKIWRDISNITSIYLTDELNKKYQDEPKGERK